MGAIITPKREDSVSKPVKPNIQHPHEARLWNP